MNPTAAILRDHIDYTAWATRKLLLAVAQLSAGELTRDFATADRSVLGTLAHLYAADRAWLGRVEGAPLATFLDPARDLHLPTLEREWPLVLEGWKTWVRDIDPDRVIAYHDLKGNAWQSSAREIVLHLVNHATHHRGQVAGFLRAMGHTPPSLDLIRFYRGLD